MSHEAASSGFLRPYLEKYVGAWLYNETALIHLFRWELPIWSAVGFVGIRIFTFRFVIQWLHTEKNKRLTVPPSFWYCSFWGSVINVIYCIHVDKAPLILGNCFLPVLYLRNLVFLGRAQQKTLQG